MTRGDYWEVGAHESGDIAGGRVGRRGFVITSIRGKVNDLSDLEHFDNLQTLEIIRQELDAADPANIKKLENLEELILEKNGLSDISRLCTTRELKKLEGLELREPGLATFGCLRKLTSLTGLEIMTDVTDREIDFVKDLSKLLTFSFSRYSPSSAPNVIHDAAPLLAAHLAGAFHREGGAVGFIMLDGVHAGDSLKRVLNLETRRRLKMAGVSVSGGPWN